MNLKKLVLLSLPCLFFQSSYAQWMLSVEASPMVGYRNLPGTEPFPSEFSYINFRNDYETQGLGWGAGAQISYKHNRWIFSSGLNFTGIHYMRKPITFTYTSTPPTPAIVEIGYNFGFNYLSVPLKATYLFVKGTRNDFGVFLSLQPSYLLSATTATIKTMSDGTTDRKTQRHTTDARYDLNRFNLFTSTGFTWNHRINDTWGFYVQPSFTYGVLSLSSSKYADQYEEKLYAYQLGLGATYQLGN